MLRQKGASQVLLRGAVAQKRNKKKNDDDNFFFSKRKTFNLSFRCIFFIKFAVSIQLMYL